MLSKEYIEDKYNCVITMFSGCCEGVELFIATENQNGKQKFHRAEGNTLAKLIDDIEDEIELRGREQK
jgi:hypothetical protein